MNERITELERRIEDLKRRLPAHSIPPTMMAELDDLEDQLKKALEEAEKKTSQDS